MVEKISRQCRNVNTYVAVRPTHACDTSPSIIRNSAKSIRAFHAKAISANRFGHRGAEKKRITKHRQADVTTVLARYVKGFLMARLLPRIIAAFGGRRKISRRRATVILQRLRYNAGDATSALLARVHPINIFTSNE